VFQNLSLDPAIASDNDARILSTTMGAVNETDLRSLVRRAVILNYVGTCEMWKTDEGKTCGAPLPRKPTLNRPRPIASATHRTVPGTTGTVN
jgi:hypothetical protein